MTATEVGSRVSGRRWRTPRPRERSIVLSFRRRLMGPALGLVVAAPIATFAAGFMMGRRSVETPRPAPVVAPAPIERVEPPRPVQDPSPLGERIVAAKETPPPPPPQKPPEPEVKIVIGPAPKLRGWGIQLGAHPEVALAERYVRAHARDLEGQRVYVIPTAIQGRGTWHRVRVGEFATRQQAEAAKKKLSGGLAKDAIVVSYR